jgi:hypothetical protein
MLRSLLGKLLSSFSSKKHYGSHGGPLYGKKYSSDSHYKPKYGSAPPHNKYGHGYYKSKKHSSS